LNVNFSIAAKVLHILQNIHKLSRLVANKCS